MATDPKPGENRSENLLPAEPGSDDGRFEVAEEVSLDQQSDATRKVGQVADGAPADALADTLGNGKPAA